MTNTIIPERLPLIDHIQPVRGPAADPGDQVPEQACVMQMAAWLTGEQWTDRPACVDPRLAALLRQVNDSLPEDVLSTWAPQVAPLAVGVTDASELLDRLAVRRLRESVLPLAPSWPDEVRGQAVAAVEQVIAAIEAIEAGDRYYRYSASWEAQAEAAAEAAVEAAEAAGQAEQQSDNRGARAARSARWALLAAAAAMQAAQLWSSRRAARTSARLSAQSAWEAAEESVAQLTAAATWVAEANRILDELRRERKEMI